MFTLPPFSLIDLDDTLLDYSCQRGANAGRNSSGVRTALRVSVEQLSTALQQCSGWYWADAERHRLGRLDLKAARRQVLRLTIEKLASTARFGRRNGRRFHISGGSRSSALFRE